MKLDDFCSNKKCKCFIEWEFEDLPHFSCKMVGESHNVDKYPENCLFLDEMFDYINNK